jgi:nicotinamide phosphoribosyltransferase
MLFHAGSSETNEITMILLTDSYKLSHWSQYPLGLTWLQTYLESRGGEYQNIVFFGLQ